MKKLLLFLFILIDLVGCSSTKEKFTLFFDDNKQDELSEIYQFDNGIRIYSEYVDIYVKTDSNEKILLKEALNQKIITIDDVIYKMINSDELNDGGSKLYSYNKDNTEFSNIDFILVKCKSLSGEKRNDYLIGHSKEIGSLCSK